MHQFTNECTIQDMCILGRPVARPKSPEGAKSFASLQGRTLGSNDGELLCPKYIGCKAKHQRVQRDVGAIDGVIAPNAPAWLRAWVVQGREVLIGGRIHGHPSPPNPKV